MLYSTSSDARSPVPSQLPRLAMGRAAADSEIYQQNILRKCPFKLVTAARPVARRGSGCDGTPTTGRVRENHICVLPQSCLIDSTQAIATSLPPCIPVNPSRQLSR